MGIDGPRKWGDRVELEDGELLLKVMCVGEIEKNDDADRWALTEWDQSTLVGSNVMEEVINVEEPLFLLSPPLSN